MELRKVIYSYWDQGTHHENQSGLFHCFAGTMQDAYALIEDVTTGKMYPVSASEMRFVQPLVREHSSDKTNEINYGSAILELLRSIDSKLKTI